MPKKPKRNNRRKKQRQAFALDMNQRLRSDLDELTEGKSRIEMRDSHIAYYDSCNIVEQAMLIEIFKEDDDDYIG